MARPLVCPECNTVNKPKAAVCRVCATRLGRTPSRSKPAEPVVLERVMSGEVFTAVTGRVAQARETEDERKARGRAGEGRKDEPESAGDEEADEEVPPAEEPRRAPPALSVAEASAQERPPKKRVAPTAPALPMTPRVAEGEELLREGRHFRAADVFEEALRENPDDEAAWLGMSRALTAAKDTRGALESVERALAIAPDDGEAWFERGLLLEAMTEVAEALRSFTRALDLLPGDASIRTHIAALQSRVANAAGSAEANAPFQGARPAPYSVAAEAPRPAGPESARGVASAELPQRPRVRTFVDGLDDALGGGIPPGSVVVVEGTPGTLKSSLAAAILLQNAREADRRGLYVTFEESAASLANQLRSLGLDPLASGDRLRFFDMRPMAEAMSNPEGDWMDALKRAVAEASNGHALDLVVLDSIDALEVLAKFPDRRRQIYRLFEWLRDLRLTAFVIAERPDVVVRDVVVQGRWDEDFLADGVVQLRLHRISDVDVQRRVRILKMRGARHETAYFALLVDDGRFRVTRAMAS